MQDADILVVYVTAPEEVAADLARKVVEAGRATCVNIIPRVRSIYRWEGAVCDEQESLLVMKTSRVAFDALKNAVLKLHPYQVPEIIALPVTEHHAPYAAWILAGSSAEGGSSA